MEGGSGSLLDLKLKETGSFFFFFRFSPLSSPRASVSLSSSPQKRKGKEEIVGEIVSEPLAPRFATEEDVVAISPFLLPACYSAGALQSVGLRVQEKKGEKKWDRIAALLYCAQ